MWEWFCQLIASIFDGVYWLVHDWGLAIILVTIVFRLLMSPIMKRQAKTSFTMQKLQPKIKDLQERYQDDPTRLNEETQKLYADAKFNPITGCLPMFLQMPIFVALFQVLRNIEDFTTSSEEFKFYNIVPNLLLTPGETYDMSATQGIGVFIPYVVLMLIFALATFLPMVLQQRNNQDTRQRSQMMIMAGMMTLMMLWLGWNSPAGVLLFWGVSSIIGIIQQQYFNSSFKKKDEIEEAKVVEQEPVAQIDVTRKQKKKRPKKKK